MSRTHLLLGLLVVAVLVWWFFFRTKTPSSTTISDPNSGVDLTFGMPQVLTRDASAATSQVPTGPKSISGFTS